MDVEKIRTKFPFIDQHIYFDNACMSLKPLSVIEAVNDYYQYFPVCNGGRGTSSLSNRLGNRIEDGRKAVKELINANVVDEIVFTKNTTESINIISNGLEWKESDKIISTDKEHNSNLAPWIRLKHKKNIKFKQVPSSEKGEFNIEEFKDIIDNNTKLVSMAHISNLDGTSIPVKKIAEITHDYGALFHLDAAQSVPHTPLDVKDIDADFVSFSIHKMLGPTGIGILYGRKELLENLEPLVVGGGSVRDSKYNRFNLFPPPKKFESGLQNYSGLCGVEPAIRFLQKVGLEEIKKHEEKLNKMITEQLKDFVGIIGPEEPEKRSGIFNFYIKDMGSQEISLLLEEENIIIRAGTHCAHSWYNKREVKEGIRTSFYLYNTEEEVKKMIDILKRGIFDI